MTWGDVGWLHRTRKEQDMWGLGVRGGRRKLGREDGVGKIRKKHKSAQKIAELKRPCGTGLGFRFVSHFS